MEPPPTIDGHSGYSRPGNERRVSDYKGDVDIQEAIRLHDEGHLEQATQMFKQLANPDGLNNALGQVLYGLGEFTVSVCPLVHASVS